MQTKVLKTTELNNNFNCVVLNKSLIYFVPLKILNERGVEIFVFQSEISNINNHL